MSKIRIITDSASDIAPDNPYGITVIPMSVRFGSTEYLDGIDLTAKLFYKKLVECDTLPTTSLISPVSFEEAYQKATENGEQVIVITLSSHLSGTYQSAVLAAQEYPGTVFVVDSKSVAVGEQILVLLANALLQEGLTPEEIVEKLDAEKEHIHVLAVLDTLEYLKKGGRISGAAAFFGSALSIKPVVGLKDGRVVILGKARGSKNGNNYLIREIESTAGVDFSKPLCLGYAGLDAQPLQGYIADSKALWEGHEDSLNISAIGPTIGSHIGPGAIAVAFFENIPALS